MLEPLYTAAEMKVAEAGHDVPAMMERAGRAVAEEALRRFPDAQAFGAVCGGGANGGDGRIALDVLRAAGRKAEEGTSGDVLIDALFGTGFRGEPRPDAAQLIEKVNGAGVPVVAVDLPSGVDADTGEIAGASVRADVTVTMHGRKVGLEVAPGRFDAGEVVVADIGLEHRETEHRLVTREVLSLVPRKRPSDTKYTAGALLVVGGAPGMTGAVSLTATAAFRADAGYVTVCAPAEALPVLEGRLVEVVKRPLEEAPDAVAKHDALAIGPGLGRSEDRQALVRRMLAETPLPAVVDADALYGLEPFERSAPTVLTPHEGELGRLLGRDSAWVAAHRLAAVIETAERFGCICLLKGADALIAAPGTGVLVAALGPPSLATAGTGDVLTGVIGAFLAKGMEARIAAAAGAVASDVVALLPAVLE
jgi:hydroxyethylthiazole kinase-like uncharacterized protein yjeF